MTRLDPSPTLLAAADLEVVAGEVLLILAGHLLDAERAAAVRAGLGKANVDDPADLVRVGNRAACVAAVGHARLAAWPSGVQHHHAFGERGGLSLRYPSQLLDLGG